MSSAVTEVGASLHLSGWSEAPFGSLVCIPSLVMCLMHDKPFLHESVNFWTKKEDLFAKLLLAGWRANLLEYCRSNHPLPLPWSTGIPWYWDWLELGD